MVSSPSGLLTFFVRFSARNRNSRVLIFKRLIVLLALTVLCLPAARGAGQTIVVVGDSLSSGYGIAAGQSWVAMLEDRLQAEGYGYQVVNASIAGDTSAGGLARLPRLLELHDPTARRHRARRQRRAARPTRRDAARQPREDDRAQSREAARDVVLAGMQIPPNYGRRTRKRSPPSIPSSPSASTRR